VTEHLSPADFAVITSTPELIQHYLPNPGDFRTDYLLMDTFTPPFDNHDVRLAFAKADIQERKAIFRKAALANVPLLRQIVSLVSLSRWCNWPLPLPRPRCSRSSFFS
jgi:hypothetical protein